MKKFAMIILILFASSQVAQSQILLSILFGDKLNSDKLEFGLNGGLNFSNIRGIPGSKVQNNWALGFYFDILLKEKSPWYIGTGVYVKSNVGGQNIAMDYEGNRDINDSVYNFFEAEHGTVAKQFNTFYSVFILAGFFLLCMGNHDRL